MFAYKKYLIRDTDTFEPFDFLTVMDDIDVIKAALASASFDSKMVIEYLKNGTTGTSSFSALIDSGALPVSNIQALFASSADHPLFQRQLEEYIKTTIEK